MAIITISRGTMSGGEALAQRLAEKLGWPAVSREVVAEASVQFGISEKDLSEQLRKNPGFFKRYGSERRLYLTALQSALIERALKGSFIYHGHAGHLLLKGVPAVLKVRLIAPLEFRVQKLQEQKGMTPDAAVRYIHQVDKERFEWTRFLYDVDWSDPASYDVVFNLISLSLDAIADMIAQAVRAPELADTAQTRATFETHALACRVRAALARHERTRGVDLDVRPEGAGFHIEASVPSGGLFHAGINTARKDIADVARSVPGVESVTVVVNEASMPVD